MKRASTPTAPALTKDVINDSKNTQTKQTVKQAVLEALLRGEKLTQHDANIRFGTSRLSGAICELRQAGYAIKTEMIKVKAAEGKATEHAADIALYSLEVQS